VTDLGEKLRPVAGSLLAPGEELLAGELRGWRG
jgi:hypothetical protein